MRVAPARGPAVRVKSSLAEVTGDVASADQAPSDCGWDGDRNGG